MATTTQISTMRYLTFVSSCSPTRVRPNRVQVLLRRRRAFAFAWPCRVTIRTRFSGRVMALASRLFSLTPEWSSQNHSRLPYFCRSLLAALSLKSESLERRDPRLWCWVSDANHGGPSSSRQCMVAGLSRRVSDTPEAMRPQTVSDTTGLVSPYRTTSSKVTRIGGAPVTCTVKWPEKKRTESRRTVTSSLGHGCSPPKVSVLQFFHDFS